MVNVQKFDRFCKLRNFLKQPKAKVMLGTFLCYGKILKESESNGNNECKNN